MCLIYRKWKTISHVKESPEWEEEKHGIDFYLRREIEWVYFDIAFLKFKKNILKKKTRFSFSFSFNVFFF